MVSRLIKAAVIAAVLALVIDSLPDIKRYLEIRDILDPRAAERM
jgi:uncharacterized protein DUF6893